MLTARTAVPFFPTPLPDDSLYGLICRYHQISGNAHPRETRKQLIGERHQWADDLLVPEVMARISIATGMDVDYLIDHFTQVPACLWLNHGHPCDGQDCLMSDDIAQELFPGLIVPKRPRVTFWRDHPKVCMTCYERDLQTAGYAYWHLYHQPQFVTVCAEHRTRLLHGCPQCGTPFKCNAFNLPLPECRFCDDLNITAGYVSHFRVLGIEVVMAQVAKRIIDVHRRPRFGWYCVPGCQRVAAHIGVTAQDLLDESNELGRYSEAVGKDLDEMETSWGLWQSEISDFIPIRRFEGFKTPHLHSFSLLGNILQDDFNARHSFASYVLWLLAYAVMRGVAVDEVVSIYMGDDYLQ